MDGLVGNGMTRLRIGSSGKTMKTRSQLRAEKLKKEE